MADGAAAEIFSPLTDQDPASVAGYRLAARLGSGGMGKVYLSYTPGGRAVAIKVIRPEFSEDPEFRRRFLSEVRLAERVQGLYTAPVIDSDVEGHHPWLATAFVPGPSLTEAVVGHGRLPVSSVLFLVAGIAEALQVIHKAGIVHRDLKPSNVLLADDGPRVIDFGIARAADATALTGSGVTIGTPSFMAPEQAEGSTVTEATDVFALGQIAAYAALGTPAFGEGTAHGVLYRIVHDEPRLDGLPGELRELVSGCLAKAAEDRPSADEVLRMCQAASGETQLRRPGNWLPDAVAADIARRAAAPVPPSSHPATQPVTGAAPQAPAPAGAGAAGPAPAQAAVADAETAHGPAAPGPAPAPSAPTASAGARQRPPGFGPAVPQPPAGFGGPPPTVGYGHPGPVGPYGAPGPPRPLPPRRKSNAFKIVAVSLVVGALILVGGCSALLEIIRGAGSGAGQGPTSSDERRPKADPEPANYKNIELPNKYFLAMSDDPLEPRELGEGGVTSELTYLNVSTDGPSLGIDKPNGKLSLLRDAQKGSLDTCRKETRFTDDVLLNRLAPGARMCLRTSSGHVGLVTYRGRSPEGDTSDYVKLDVTVWRDAIEAKNP
ncbi:serine/threonine-protein kinase [Streptomyces reniochalinae]|uniref:Serine/threonine protein kinase n=1 Tax=Streptomyces reniochalinae TaxID=2250578 RepID=A0A367EFE6_9ACTN|nr:serine/threonine-protein kinase [Streptomyces reniochalinae]RCG15950.1 serine/threonine protein kinase [Streptomyces reniochalinae]